MEIGDLVVKISADLSEWSGNITAATEDVAKLGAVAGVASTVASSALGVMTGAFEELMSAIPNATEAAAEFARSIEAVSEKTGLSDQFILALTPALAQVNLKASDLSQGFRRLSLDIQAAQNPASKQAEMFHELGLSAAQLADPGQALTLIADRLSQMEDGFQKTALAGELMSRTGINLIPILNQGAAGFAASGAKAQEMGLILSTSAMHALEQLHVSYADAALASDSFSTHLGIAFAPIIQAFNQLKVSASELGITFVDNLGQAMLTLTARAEGLYGFLKEQAALPLSAGLDGLIAVWKKWNDQTTAAVSTIREQTIALIDQGNVFTQADAHVAAYFARMQAIGDAQEKIGVALRNTAVAARQADEAQYGTKTMTEAIKLSGMFLETITPNTMQAELDKGNQIVEGAMRDRAIAITEYGKAAVETANRVNALFGAGTTDPSQGNNQEQLGLQAENAFKAAQAANAMRLQDEVTIDQAVLAEQNELYKNESMYIGAAEAARQVANTALEAQQAQQRATLKLQLDGGVIDYQSYETRLQALETEGTAKRMQIISQYPTFVEKQLGDLVNSNAFSMSQISTTFTSNISKMIVEGGKLTKMWTQIEETMVQGMLNAGIQMLAQSALNFLKETGLFSTMETAKTEIANTMGTERMAAQEAEQTVGKSGAEAALVQISALADASSAILETVVTEMAAVYEAIGTALASNPFTAELAPPFFEGGIQIEAVGSEAVMAAQPAISGAVEAAASLIGGTGVPALAGGGLVMGPTLALVGESGPEAVIPLNQVGGVGGDSYTFVTELDGEVIAQSTLKYLPRLVRMNARSMR